MASKDDLATAIDRFMQATKTVVGADQPGAWRQGFSPNESVIYLPLEIDGEQTGTKLMIVAFPRSFELKFRLGLLCMGAVCRLDFTDETHPNTNRVDDDGVPAFVQGPHYHSWPINRRFFKGQTTAPKLKNAVPYDGVGRQFDAILRWFLADTNTEALPPSHRIQLPPMDRLPL